GHSAYIFWTRQPSVFSFREYLDKPQSEQVRALIESVHRAKPTSRIDDDAFYCAALSAHGGRAVVRDWIDTTLARVKETLVRWFERQMVVGPWGEPPRAFGVVALAGTTVRTLNELTSGITDSLIHSALVGTTLPLSLLSAALRRIQADQTITHAR